jgi:hypothetical protein
MENVSVARYLRQKLEEAIQAMPEMVTLGFPLLKWMWPAFLMK